MYLNHIYRSSPLPITTPPFLKTFFKYPPLYVCFVSFLFCGGMGGLRLGLCVVLAVLEYTV